MKRARVIVTLECKRNCSYCCNKYEVTKNQMKPLQSLKELLTYDEVILSGGEPFLYPNKLLTIINYLRRNSKIENQKIYIQTAMPKFGYEFNKIIKKVDGINYTLHFPATYEDISDFMLFQDIIKSFKEKSFRLLISPDMEYSIIIYPNRWSRIESKPWIPKEENCLPEGEELFLLKRN